MGSRGGSLTAASPFMAMGLEMLASGDFGADDTSQTPAEQEPVLEMLEDFGDTPYEDDADLDPLSAMEKYCRSELPQQRLAYAAGMGAAMELFQPHEVAGTIIALLRELLGDVYADVRLAALQQVLPVARRLRVAGSLYQHDIETLWDLVQKLLLDADVENQEMASMVLAELSHIVAAGNAVAASQKLVTAVQRLQRLPLDIQAEGALASLRLITEVVVPRPGSPLSFATIEEFCVSTFKAAITDRDALPDVRQAVALLLPRFARHMPPALKATLLPQWLKTLSEDTHWNVRAEVPQLLINLLTPQDPQQQHLQQQQQLQQAGALPPDAAAAVNSGRSARDHALFVLVTGHEAINKWRHTMAGPCEAATGAVLDGWGAQELRLLCDIVDRLTRDTSLQVRVAALASLGQLLPLLPASLVTSHKPPLLSHFASTAKPPPQLCSTKVPAALCPPRLSGHVAAMRHRQRQQRRQQQRAAEARDKSCNRALQELVQEGDAVADLELQKQAGDMGADAAGDEDAGAGDSSSDTAANAAYGDSSSSATSSSGAGTRGKEGAGASAGDDAAATAAPATAAAPAAPAEGHQERWVLPTASDTPVGVDESESKLVAADSVDATTDANTQGNDGTGSGSNGSGGSIGSGSSGTGPALAGAGSSGQQQQQRAPPPEAGTAAAELPCSCAVHIGKVALHVGPTGWTQLQGAFLELAVAAVNGDCDVAAALLLTFPALSQALGHQEAAHILVPLVLELLHTRMDALLPVLSVTLVEVVEGLAPDLRICLLQMLPNLVLQIDSELAGDWRARLAVAQQLSAVAAMVTHAQVAYCLWPLLLSLTHDPVFAVRLAAAQQVGPLLLQLPEQEQPPELGDTQKAAAAAAAIKSAQLDAAHSTGGSIEPGASAGDMAPASAAAAAGEVEGGSAQDAEAAEQVIAAVVATHAVTSHPVSVTSSISSAHTEQQRQQQQQMLLEQEQQEVKSGPSGARLSWMRRGLSSGLLQLQQQVDRVMESPGMQKALNGVDQQLTWLQQHPQGKVLWDLGSKLAQGVRVGADAAQAADAPGAQITLEDLRKQLTSLQVIEAAELDPCKFLLTPGWPALAGELAVLGDSRCCSDRIVYAVAAGSILSAYMQQQQQQQRSGGQQYLQQLLQTFQSLASDPTPGVRCAVAAVLGRLLSQEAFVQDAGLLDCAGSSSTASGTVQSSAPGSTTTSSTTTSPTGRTPSAQGTPCSSGGGCGGSSNAGTAAAAANPQHKQQGALPAGFSSLNSSGSFSMPCSALTVLQDCLLRLQQDACVSVAETARASASLCGLAAAAGTYVAPDAGAAVAAADAADAAVRACSPPVAESLMATGSRADEAGKQQGAVAGAADLL